MTNLYVGTLPKCPTAKDLALCGLVASTNIAAIRSEWGCTVSGTVSGNPCAGWMGVQCDMFASVVSLVLNAGTLIGIFVFRFFAVH